MIRVSASRWISRAGWLLTHGTILTAVSIVPIFDERPAFGWLSWLGVPGTLVAALIVRLFSPDAFLVASVLGFFANTIFFAAILGLAFHVFEAREARAALQL